MANIAQLLFTVGTIAVAVAFWIGLGFVALAIIAALIRGRFP